MYYQNYKFQKPKDPQRQLHGKISKEKGQCFEDRLDRTFEYYKTVGSAAVEKTPEPMHPVKNLGNGKFIAFFEKKAQPDYKGTLKGGRAVMYEAKFTDSDKMLQSRVSSDQKDYLDLHSKLGARCFVVIGFGTGEVYKIPWEIWREMKRFFGRKYVTETDVKKHRVPVAWNDTLMLLD